MPDGNMLDAGKRKGFNILSSVQRDEHGKILPASERLIPIAMAELWVREKTGKNDGKRVEEYLASVKLKKGDPYCAAFVSWVFKEAGYDLPRTGWSPALFPAAVWPKLLHPEMYLGFIFRR
jgi:hypothetical protein